VRGEVSGDGFWVKRKRKSGAPRLKVVDENEMG